MNTSIHPVTRRSAPLILVLALSIGATAPAAVRAGDWLVTTDGERIETRGPWTVAGKTIRFENARRVLSSIPLEAIDLEASRMANAPPPPPAAPAPPLERAPVRVLTDRDFAPVPVPTAASEEPGPATGTEAAGGEGGAADGTASPGSESAESAAGNAGAVTVSSWQEQSTDRGLVFTGTIANGTNDISIMGLELQAELRDHDGEVVETRSASLASTALSAGASTTFTVEFPDRFAYSEIVFKPSGRPLNARARTPAAGEPAPAGADAEAPASDGAAETDAAPPAAVTPEPPAAVRDAP